MATLTYNWQPPTSGPPDSYNVYEGPSAGTETLLASVPGTITAYDHKDALPGSYHGYIKAVVDGVESAASNETSGIIKALPPDLEGLQL